MLNENLKLKSILLDKRPIKNGFYMEFYNPSWGRFATNFEYKQEDPGHNNRINLARVGEYYLIKGKAITPIEINSQGEKVLSSNELREFKLIKYLSTVKMLKPHTK